MTDLLWPGDERAGDLMSDAAFLMAMVRVEEAWLHALVECRLAPAGCADDLSGLVSVDDVPQLAADAEGGGNPVIPLVDLMRSRADTVTAWWLHQGLTSQDVLDTALVLTLREALDRLDDELESQIAALIRLAERHASTPMVGRTLTQHAVPTTFGVMAATWLDSVVDAADVVATARGHLAAQLGGAVGTLAATTELARLTGRQHPTSVAAEVVETAGRRLDLPTTRPWHTSRSRVTGAGSALLACTDAWGRIATDVTTRSRTEIGELAEPAAAGRGQSSAMPHKRNPVLAVLVRRAALAAPALQSTLHLAAATTGDQRPDGAWHVEWATLRALTRRAVVASSQLTELLEGLQVDTRRMSATLDASAASVLAERRAVADLVHAEHDPDADPRPYLGIALEIVADSVARAHRRRGAVS